MSASDEPISLGFFTVVQCDRMGWTGGLLVLNPLGRPLEFRCTLPIRPSRTHEVLFGSTIRAHLIGEAIPNALLKSCQTPLSMLFCHQPEAIRAITDCPSLFVHAAAEADEGDIDVDSIDGAVVAEFAGSNVSVPVESFDRVERILAQLVGFPDAVEPFARVREAIREAHSQLARAA